MILNSYAVLMMFVAGLRLAAGVVIAMASVAAWRANRSAATAEERSALESRTHLLFLLTFLLLLLNLVSWPLLYLLLQSYVPEWPGIMCIYGVTQIGRHSFGSSRFLPALLEFLQIAKPALIFLGGLWFVLFLINRGARRAPLLGLLFTLLVPFGALAAIDAGAELSYVSIPKKNVYPSTGCCTVAAEQQEQAALASADSTLSGDRQWYVAFYALDIGMILALYAVTARGDTGPGSTALAMLLIGGAATFAAGSLFLVEAAAPRILNLPYHHCAYDLIPEAPEVLIAVGLFVSGEFFLGWAGAANWLARGAGTEAIVPRFVRSLLRLSLCGFLSSLLMLSLELVLA